jgi:hypothetical protein
MPNYDVYRDKKKNCIEFMNKLSQRIYEPDDLIKEIGKLRSGFKYWIDGEDEYSVASTRLLKRAMYEKIKSSDIKGGVTISENLDIIKKYVHKHGDANKYGDANGITKILVKCSEDPIHKEAKEKAIEATEAYNKYKDNFFKLFQVSKYGLQNSDPIGLPKYCSEEIEKYVAYEYFLGKMGSKAKGGILLDEQYANHSGVHNYSNDRTISFNTEVTGDLLLEDS